MHHPSGRSTSGLSHSSGRTFVWDTVDIDDADDANYLDVSGVSGGSSRDDLVTSIAGSPNRRSSANSNSNSNSTSTGLRKAAVPSSVPSSGMLGDLHLAGMLGDNSNSNSNTSRRTMMVVPPPQPPDSGRRGGGNGSSIVKALANMSADDDESLSSYISSLQNSLEQYSNKLNNDNSINNSNNNNNSSNSNKNYSADDSSSAAHSAINELKLKVEAMKVELAEKASLVKDAKNELIRVISAKERRIERLKTSNDAKLKSIMEENEAIVKKQNQLVAKVGDDVKSLSEKYEALKGKESMLIDSKDAALEIAQTESKKKVARTRRQWEVDERAIIEKHVESKVTAMKKSIAESMGPGMDRKVEDMRIEIRTLQKSLDTAYEVKRLQLETEFNEKLAAEIAKFEADLKGGNSRIKTRFENEIQDLKSRHADELATYKTSHLREKQHIEELGARRRQQEGESAALELKSKKLNFQQMLQELETSCQRDLNLIARKHREEIDKLESELALELKDMTNKHTQAIKKRDIIALREFEESMTLQIESETHKIIAKVREDAVTERLIMRRDKASELEVLRSTLQLRIDDITSKEKRSLERLRALKEEVDQLSKSRLEMNEVHDKRKQKLYGSKKQVQLLRAELHEVETDLAKSEALRNGTNNNGIGSGESDSPSRNSKVKIQKLQSSLDKWRGTENELQSARIEKERKGVENRELMLRENRDEITRIKDKIRRVFSTKDATIRDNRSQLEALQTYSSQLLSKLEALRESMIMPTSTPTAGAANMNNNNNTTTTTTSSSRYGLGDASTVTSATATVSGTSNSSSRIMSGSQSQFSRKSTRK